MDSHFDTDKSTDKEVKVFVPVESKEYPGHYETGTPYVITADGKSIISKITGKMPNVIPDRNGYLWIPSRPHGGEFAFSSYIHQFVCLAFIGPRPIYDGKEPASVNHKDGNRINNHYSNLEWCSRRENMYHAWKTGLCDDSKRSVFVQNAATGKITKFNSIADCSRAHVKNGEGVERRLQYGPDRVWPSEHGPLRYSFSDEFNPLTKEEIESALSDYSYCKEGRPGIIRWIDAVNPTIYRDEIFPSATEFAARINGTKGGVCSSMDRDEQNVWYTRGLPLYQYRSINPKTPWKVHTSVWTNLYRPHVCNIVAMTNVGTGKTEFLTNVQVAEKLGVSYGLVNIISRERGIRSYKGYYLLREFEYYRQNEIPDWMRVK